MHEAVLPVAVSLHAAVSMEHYFGTAAGRNFLALRLAGVGL